MRGRVSRGTLRRPAFGSVDLDLCGNCPCRVETHIILWEDRRRKKSWDVGNRLISGDYKGAEAREDTQTTMKQTTKRTETPEGWKEDPEGVPFDWFNSIGFVASRRKKLERWLDKNFHHIDPVRRERFRRWLDEGARTPEDVQLLGLWVKSTLLPEVRKSIAHNEDRNDNDER